MSADELVAALESKTGADFFVELSSRTWGPPLSALHDRLHELPTVLRVAMSVIVFETVAMMDGAASMFDEGAGPTARHLNETIEALETIGAVLTAGTLDRVRTILRRHGVDLTDREGLEKYYHDHEADECGDLLKAEISAEFRSFAYGSPRPHEHENVFGLLQDYVEANRDALLQAIRSYAGAGAA